MNQFLKIAIAEDKEYYYGEWFKRIYRMMTHNPVYQRGKYIIVARKAGYYSLNCNSILKIVLCFYYTRKKNILGEKLGIELGPNEFGRRIRIYHNNIVVNGGAIIGDDCELYGNNCIGNKGSDFGPLDAPILANSISIGVGAKVIGKVQIADNIKISSMSLVNKDLKESGALYGGIPVQMIKKL
ncbi:hypothetical protein NXH76_13520 [Blautia schinkii]|nr:hypothetical protein [Blautia schinkii]